jgi:hypothetical protein
MTVRLQHWFGHVADEVVLAVPVGRFWKNGSDPLDEGILLVGDPPGHRTIERLGDFLGPLNQSSNLVVGARPHEGRTFPGTDFTFGNGSFVLRNRLGVRRLGLPCLSLSRAILYRLQTPRPPPSPPSRNSARQKADYCLRLHPFLPENEKTVTYSFTASVPNSNVFHVILDEAASPREGGMKGLVRVE